MTRVIAFIIAIMPAIVSADCMDFTERLLKNDYVITISEQDFTLSFDVATLVDCPYGTATLSYEMESDGWTKQFDIELDFTTTNEWIKIDGLGYCFLSYDKLVLIPLDTPMMLMQKQSAQIIFPWPE